MKDFNGTYPDRRFFTDCIADRRTDAGYAADVSVTGNQCTRRLLVPACASFTLVRFLAAIAFSGPNSSYVVHHIPVRRMAFAAKYHWIIDHSGIRDPDRSVPLFVARPNFYRDNSSAAYPLSCFSPRPWNSTCIFRLVVTPLPRHHRHCNPFIDRHSRRPQDAGLLAGNKHLLSSPCQSSSRKCGVYRLALAGVLVHRLSTYPRLARQADGAASRRVSVRICDLRCFFPGTGRGAHRPRRTLHSGPAK